MTPVYLPFSTIEVATAENLLRWFATITLYQPRISLLPEALAPWLSEGRIRTCIPVDDADGRLERALTICHRWAQERDLGRGGAAAFLRAQSPVTPLYDDEAVGRLRRQILSGGPSQKDTLPEDPVFDARLFLAMAEAYDRDSAQAARQLQALQALEMEVLQEMHAETQTNARIGPPTAALAAAEDRGALMTSERLRAWATLASQDVAAPALMVTDSRAVADELLEFCSGAPSDAPTATLEVSLEGIESADPDNRQAHLMSWLAETLTAEAPRARFTCVAAGLPQHTGEGPVLALHLLESCPTGHLLQRLLPRGVSPRWHAGSEQYSHGILAALHA
ncbi:MAG: hypothetical protein QNJ22_03570 [Desulfosarcinaceae bacterium]|nr:hypothetical protein [Desulfosarcinaceae bacterium]